MYKGKGLQHLGMGVGSKPRMVEFYRKTLEFTEVFEEFENVWNAMPEAFRYNPHSFGGGIWDQKASGIMVELIWMYAPVSRPIRAKKRYGDLSVNKITIAVPDAEKFYRGYKGKINFCDTPKTTDLPGLGAYSFVYGADPEGNLIEFASWSGSGAKDGFGGCTSVGVSVTDLERSLAFYQKYLGFKKIVAEPHEAFSGLVDKVAESKGSQVRSCLLANPKGGGMVELFELMKPRGRALGLNTYWGDYGYLEICLDNGTESLRELESYYMDQGLEFVHHAFMAEVLEAGEIWFMYVKDPDGVPLEFISVFPKG